MLNFNKKTVKDYNLKGKTVLIRVDYNVPLKPGGGISDDYRMTASLPTLEYLLKQNCKIIICSHLGRPKPGGDRSTSLRPVAEHLSKLIKKGIGFVDDCVGDDVKKAVSNLPAKNILMLENLRFHPEEEANDPVFAKQLASLADVFVEDGFGVVHRAHASTVGVTKFLPALSGLLLEKEVSTINQVMAKPARPLLAIIAGAKIEDKIDILNRFIDLADVVAIGGAMANTFLLAKGIKIGKSRADKKDVPLARDILEKAKKRQSSSHFVFYIPQDGVVAKSLSSSAKTRIVDWSAHVIADIEAYPKHSSLKSSHISEDEEILDAGPFSGAFIAGAIQLSNTVIWNGTLGVTETPANDGPIGPFAHGTELVIEAMLGKFGHRPYSLVGGGDTAGYIENRGLIDQFDHVSTGGGASLDLMSGHKLPGVEALLNKGN